MKTTIDIIIEALNSVAMSSGYEIKGPDLAYKIKLEIERIQEREDKAEEKLHKEAINETVS